MDYSTWIARWQTALVACRHLGGEARELVVGPPASEDDLAAIEEQIGNSLPTSFCTVLTEFSAHVEMSWFLPDKDVLPRVIREISSGEISWSLEGIVRAEASRRLWVEKCFADVTDAYDAVWHNKLGFSEVANGDVIAFDLSVFPDSPVVYLSHDDGDGHGYRLGINFADYIDRFSLLGCPGNEDLQTMPFLNNVSSGLDAYGLNAVLWRNWFGLNIEVQI